MSGLAYTQQLDIEIARLDSMVKSLENLERQCETKNTKQDLRNVTQQDSRKQKMEKKGKPRSGIPVPLSHSPPKPISGTAVNVNGTASVSTSPPRNQQNDGDVYTETVSVKTAVHMFGGEAKIRKLPTPVPTEKASEKTGKSNKPPTQLCQGGQLTQDQLSVDLNKDIDLDFGAHDLDVMDYPIRGTISPLTDGMHNKCYGNEASMELSFVFGRPASPDTEQGISRCKSPTYQEGRPMSPAMEDEFVRTKRRAVSGIYNNSSNAQGGLPPSGRGGKSIPANTAGVYDKMVVHLPPTGRKEKLVHGGVCCQHCNNCLIHFKRQALRLMYPDGARGGSVVRTPKSVEKIVEKLQVPENSQRFLKNSSCDVCDTSVLDLKREAVAMVQTIQQAQSEPSGAANIPALVGSCNFRPQQRSNSASSGSHARYLRQGKSVGYMPSGVPLAAQAQAYLDQSVSSRTSPKKQMLAPRSTSAGQIMSGGGQMLYSSPEILGQGMDPNSYQTHVAAEYPSMYPSAGYNPNMMQHHQQTIGHHQQTMGHHQQTMGHHQQTIGHHQQTMGHHQQTMGHHQQQQYYVQDSVPCSSAYPAGNYSVSPQNPYHPQQTPPNLHYAMPAAGKLYGSPPPYMTYSVPPPQHQPPPPPSQQQQQLQQQQASPLGITRMASPASPPPVNAAAVSFFARAAQKLSKKKKRQHQPPEPEPPPFPTKYWEVVRLTPPPAPPCLLRTAGRLQTPGVGKVKVMLKICPSQHYGEQGTSFLAIDPRKKQVTVFDPTSGSGFSTAAHRRTSAAAPKMFAFDAVFSPDDSQTEICASSLTEIIQGVVNGADGCLFTYGHSKLGKTYTMIGQDHSAQTLGIIPCAIAWLFRLINEQKEKTGARFSVRVSAVEVSGRQESLKDLLSDVAKGVESGSGTAPGVYLREDPICGTQLENQSELRAPTADRATYYLDAAIAARTQLDEEESRSSHLLFTLHVYQYRIEKSNIQAGLPGVAGGRSRLHLIDLGSSSKSKDPSNVSLSLSALGNVLMALLNGQRHVPHRDSKVAQLLRDSLGNISCRTCMIAHVSSAVPHYNETLQVIQMAARIHRMRRRKTKFSSTSSDDSSTDDGHLRRPFRGFRMGTLREDVLYSSSHSDPDYTSSSEQSCDTVIYVGANGQSLSDRELTDHEGPPRSVPRTNPRLPRRPSGSRSSGDEGSNSDSGRSHISHRPSDYQLAKPPNFVYCDVPNTARMPLRMITPVRDVSVCSAERAQSPPLSPNMGAIQLPRKANIRTKLVTKMEDSPSVTAGKSDKVSSRTSTGVSAKVSNAGEQWIDGPGAAIYPDKSKTKTGEQWVDGPQAFIKQSEQNKNKDSNVNRCLFNPKMNAEEQWVDGPREMMADSDHKESRHHGKVSVHSSGRTDRRSRDREHSQESKTTSASHLKAGVKVKHSAASELKDRPDSMGSADSAGSMTVQAADSRPTSMHSNTAVGDVEHLSKTDEFGEAVKPFVRDWVEKHSAMNSENKTESAGSIVDSDNQVIGSIETSNTNSYKRPKPDSRSTKKIRSSTPKHSPHHSPRNSPALVRKGKQTDGIQKLNKSQLPSSANPTHRVTEWLRSVSTEQEMEVDSREHLERMKSIEHDNSQDVSSCSSVQQDTSMECDSQINMADLTQNDGVQFGGGEGRSDEMAECNIADISFDSSVDTSEFSNMLLANRESIYEIQMDEQLEKSAVRSTSDVADDETFSSASCNKDNELTEGEAEDAMENEPLMTRVPHSSTIESLKTLVAEPVQPISSEQNMCGKIFNVECSSPAISEYDNPVPPMNQPLLLRKPDGASNPNLLSELNFEGKVDRGFMRGDYIINTLHSISGHPQDIQELKPKNTTSKYTSLPKHVEALKALENMSREMIESKRLNSNKSKPPLPIKPFSKSSTHSPSPSRQSPTKTVVGFREKDSASMSPKSVSSTSSKNSSIPIGSSASNIARLKDKDKTGRLQSTSSSSSPRSNSLAVMGSPSSTSTLRSTSSKSSKSQSPGNSRLPIFSSSKNGTGKDSKSRKGNKDVKGSKMGNGRVTELNRSSSRGTDSDSGNDSGIVTNEKKLLSPYSTVTKPRTPSHSSSGHGSDNSSTISAELRNQLGCKTDKIHGGTSSGYESMLRDSEGTASSSAHEDSNSESSNDKKKGSRRKRSSTRRSRSAPARSSESPENKKQQSPSGTNKTTSPSPKAWVDTRQIQKIKEEPFEIKCYDVGDVERLGRRRADEESKENEARKEKLKELIGKQQGQLKGDSPELMRDQIVLERGGWTFDCKFLSCFSCRSRSKKTDV